MCAQRRYGNVVRTRRSTRKISRAPTYSHRSSFPKSVRAPGGGFRVTHEEYIGDVIGPATTDPRSAFASQVYGINPGDAGTFPWLATLANSFEEYTWNRVAFCYKTTSSDAIVAAAGTSAMGVIVMATQYNSNNPPFTSRQQMELYQGSMSVKPSLSACHYVECRRNLTPYQTLYIRANQHFLNDTVLGPLQNYDVGQFTIATCNTNGGVLGELWVKYDVTLKKPKLSLINQPFLSAMDFGLAPVGIIPSLPNSGTGSLFSNLANGVWNPISVVKSFEDNPALALVTYNTNTLRQLGCDYIPQTAIAANNGYLRFPDEAPLGTTIHVHYVFRVVCGATDTYDFAAPVVAQAAAWPPAVNKCVGCELVSGTTSMHTFVNLTETRDLVVSYIFRRVSNTGAGINLPWGWNPGAFTGTPVNSPTCATKSLSITYVQTNLPSGVTGAPAGTALW